MGTGDTNKALADRIDKIDAKYDSLNSKLDKVLWYLNNDTETGEKGLIQGFKDHKEQMDRFLSSYNTEKKVAAALTKQRATIFGTIFGVVGGAVAAFVRMLIEQAHK